MHTDSAAGIGFADNGKVVADAMVQRGIDGEGKNLTF